MVYPALDINPAGFLIFLLGMFTGIFILMAMLTGIFESTFSTNEALAKKRLRWWHRTGLVAAYCLIDLDGDENVSNDEFTVIIDKTTEMFSKHVLLLKKCLNLSNK